jgi:hypothetical protein
MKRKRSAHMSGGSRKKARPATPSGPDHPVLQRLYPQVLTLRHYLSSQLPKSSKNRRRRISQLGLTTPVVQDHAPTREIDIELGQLLDSTLVGCSLHIDSTNQEQESRERNREIESFTQQRSQNNTGGTFKPGYFLQSEVGQVTQNTVSQSCTWQWIQIW